MGTLHAPPLALAVPRAASLGTRLDELPLPSAALRVARRLGWGTVGEFVAVPPAVLRALGVGPVSLEGARIALVAAGVAPTAWTTTSPAKRKGRRKRPGPPPTWLRIRTVVPASAYPRSLATLTNAAGRPLLPRAVRALSRNGIGTIGDLLAQSPEALLALVSRVSLTRLAAALLELDAARVPSPPSPW
jgi:hypothetical protein